MENNSRAVLFVMTLAGFLSTFSASSVIVALPGIGRDFGIDAVSLNWLVTAFILASAAILIPAGSAADAYGRKRFFLIGLVFYLITGVIAAIADSSAVLLAARVFQGFGASLLAATSTAILISVYPPEQRGRVLGINIAAIYIGLSAGPVLGGFLTELAGWRSVFWFSAAMAVLILPISISGLKGEWKEIKPGRPDIAGAVLYAASLTILILGLSQLPSVVGIALSVAGALVLCVFVIFENRNPHPMLDISLFRRNRVFAFSNLAAMISYAATFSVSFFLSLYLQSIKGFNAQTTGLILVVQPLVQAVLSPYTGKLSDRVEPRILASAGMGLTSVGLLVLAVLGAESSVILVGAALFLLGMGFALFSSPNTNAIMGSVEKRHLGIASASVATMRTIGQVASMAVALVLTNAYVGHNNIDVVHNSGFLLSMRVGFVLFAVLCFGGIFASLSRGKMRAPQVEVPEVPPDGN